MQFCTLVLSCAKVQKKCRLNRLIYNCKRRLCTNVLFFSTYTHKKKIILEIVSRDTLICCIISICVVNVNERHINPPAPPQYLMYVGCAGVRMSACTSSILPNPGARGKTRKESGGVDKSTLKDLFKLLTMTNFVLIIRTFCAHTHDRNVLYIGFQ